MKTLKTFEFPDNLKADAKKAVRLEWITVLYLLSTAFIVYLTMGSSQSMKTAWFEDLISLTPSVSFLIASKFINKTPTERFPYGYHRVVSIAYLVSSFALFGIGLYLFLDSGMKLINQEHVSIGSVEIFGERIWLGYLMIAAMLYGTFPALILGHMKIPLAKKLHDKNLYSDAIMNKADWMTASAAILGITGIGFGLWWADAVAAIIISIDILYDGFRNLKQAVFDLMDEIPKTVEGDKIEPILDRVQEVLRTESWIQESSIRIREEGHIFTGEGFFIPKDEEHLLERTEELTKKIQGLDWKMHHFTLTPVKSISQQDV